MPDQREGTAKRSDYKEILPTKVVFQLTFLLTGALFFLINISSSDDSPEDDELPVSFLKTKQKYTKKFEEN